MGKDYQSLFNQNKGVELPQDLLGSVLIRIRSEQKKSARKELIFVGGIAVWSLIAIIPAWSYFITSFIQSSFYQYFSLIWSEGLNATVYWKEISMSLAESLPIFSIAIFLFALVISIWSIARTTRDVKIVFRPV